MRKMELLDVDLTALVFGGDALGRLPDGRAVFVPKALPGERVRVRLLEEKARFARAELVEVLSPSPKRIQARCVHFSECGVCHYQHLSYADQLAVKGALVREQFARIAGLPDAAIREVIPAGQEWNYRSAVQFQVSPNGRLAYPKTGGTGLLEIRECHLPEAPLNELWPALEFEPGSGIEKLELRLGSQGDQLLSLEGPEANPPEFSTDLPVSAVYRSPAGEIVMGGDAFTLMDAGGRTFQVSAASFFRANASLASVLIDKVFEFLPQKMETALDVYCGVGLFSAFLAQRCQRLVGVEISPSACEDFAVNLDEFEHVELYQGSAEDVLPHLDIRPDAVLVDPPRTGLERPALDAIVRMKSVRIVYVSCDAATLARDTGRLLKAGYSLAEVAPVDLFPQTYHVECVAWFSRD